MKRYLRLALICCILIASIVIAPKVASAQVQCINYAADFPTGWSIDQGTQQGNFVYDASHVYVTHLFSPAIQVTSVTIDWRLIYPNPDANPLPLLVARVAARLYRSGNQVDYDTNRLTQGNPGDWQRITYDFNSTQSEGLTVDAVADPQYSPTIYANVRVASVCFVSIPPSATPAPSWTPSRTNTPLPTNTPSNTPIPPTATNTPVPTNTPIPTDTLTPSDTPPGPTDTPSPTDTPGPTDTPSPPPTDTLIPPLESGDFNSPEPPEACRDPFNPCGPLPFPPPQFSGPNLPSPTPLPAVSLNTTSTPVPFMTVSAAPSTGTATFTGIEQNVYDAATNIASSFGEIVITPGLNDANGDAVSFQDAGNQIGTYVGQAFSVFRAIQGFFLGKTGNIIALLLLIVAFILFVRILCFFLPILKAVANFVFTIIKIIPFLG